MLPLKLVGGKHIEFGAVVVDSTGTTLTSATKMVELFRQPVTLLVTKTVYGFGAPVGPPSLMAVADVPLLAAAPSAPTPTTLPAYH